MLVKDVIEFFGGSDKGCIRKAADAFKVDPSTVTKWKLKELLPVECALKAEVLSKGKLKFDKKPYLDELRGKMVE